MKITFKPRILDGESFSEAAPYRVQEDIHITEQVPKITTLFDAMRSTLPMCEIKPMEDHIAETYLKPALVNSTYPEQRYSQVTLCFNVTDIENDKLNISVRSSSYDDKDKKTFAVTNSPEVDKLFGPSALEWCTTFGVPIFRTYHLDI